MWVLRGAVAIALASQIGCASAMAQAADQPYAWPTRPKAPAGAPNILVIMTDDVGFGASSTFGGPIATPTFDRLAARGLRYTNFHTTAICSSTRAALLTGRNHHAVGMGRVTDAASPADGYTTILPKSAATVAEVLRQNGYNTAMFGKSHLVPQWEESAAGPFDHWPTGLGFEYFYGFLNGDTDQFAPQLFQGTTPVEPPADDPHYILDKDLADKATQWIADHEAAAPDKPFMLYYASGTAHSPHQAPADWIARYKGKFDQGWDAVRAETLARQKQLGLVPATTRLSARPAMLPAWDSLPPERKRVYARMMEVYAAALSYDDAQVGRMVDMLERTGQLDNTLIIYVQGDNGSSPEGHQQGLWNELTFINQVPEDFAMVQDRLATLGGPMAQSHFPAAWANAMSTPFPYFKRVASHLGSDANGMVISWPRGIHDQGGLRTQFSHVIDVMPTILEAAHIPAPAVVNGVQQKPIQGVSLVYSFDAPKAPERHKTQYFEMEGNQALYHDGWLASTRPVFMPWDLSHPPTPAPSDGPWELYDLSKDFSQSVNLAARYPQKLAQMKALFAEQARENSVLVGDVPRGGPPGVRNTRAVYRYVAPVSRIPAPQAPDLLNRSFEIEATVDIPKGGANGVLVTHGGRFGGYGLYLDHSVPVFAYNRLGIDVSRVRGAAATGPGRHRIKVRFAYDGGGVGKGGDVSLMVDDAEVAKGRVAATIPRTISLSETFDVGLDTGTAVTDDYATPAAFTGGLVELTVRPGERPPAVTPNR